jgi:hypothetical protein
MIFGSFEILVEGKRYPHFPEIPQGLNLLGNRLVGAAWISLSHVQWFPNGKNIWDFRRIITLLIPCCILYNKVYNPDITNGKSRIVYY